VNTFVAKYFGKGRKGVRGSNCHYCKTSLVYDSVKRGQTQPLNRGTIDHRVPVCRGGQNRLGNYVSACRKCNEEKGQLTEKEYLVVLRYRKSQAQRRALLGVLFILLVKISVLVRKCS